MGSDFLQRVGKTLKRSWDEGRAAMASPDLTTRELEVSDCGIPADVIGNPGLRPGDQLNVELDGGAIVARRGLTVVARNGDPPAAAVGLLSAHCNIRPGQVSEVHDHAGMVEITIKC